MGIIAQRVEKEDIEAVQLVLALRRNLAVVRQVGAVSKFEAMHSSLSVKSPNGFKIQPGNMDRLVIKDAAAQPRAARFRRSSIEDVLKRLLNHTQCACGSVNWYLLPLHEIKWANII